MRSGLAGGRRGRCAWWRRKVISYYLTFDDDGYEDVQATVDAAGYIWMVKWVEPRDGKSVHY
jgi:hypothetical protein